MNAIMWIHIGGGLLALLAGTAAVAARKGGRMHARAGTWFALSMLVLGATATLLARVKGDQELGLGGVVTCYFVLTAWVTARRRDGSAGTFEAVAGAAAIGTGALIAWAAVMTDATTPAGRGPLFVIAFACLLAGAGDLKMLLAGKLSAARRLSRHVWRMCAAFFIATGSFFIGQQDVMPVAVRGSPFLFVLGFAPFAVMLYWLVKLRFTKAIARSKRSGLIFIGREAPSNG